MVANNVKVIRRNYTEELGTLLFDDLGRGQTSNGGGWGSGAVGQGRQTNDPAGLARRWKTRYEELQN
jgi:hypothetical protein